MLWYSELERLADCGSERVGGGRWSESLAGSLFDRFSGAGDCGLEDVVGVCDGLAILGFFSAG